MDEATLLRLGYHPTAGRGVFHMTAASHSPVASGERRIRAAWRRFRANCASRSGPDRNADEVPVGHVTNGVHLATWMANPIMQMLDEHLGASWGSDRDPASWERVLSLDDEKLWGTHLRLKHVLMRMVREKARQNSARACCRLRSSLVPAPCSIRTRSRSVLRVDSPRTSARTCSSATWSVCARSSRTARVPCSSYSPARHIPPTIPASRYCRSVYQFTRDPRFEGRIVFIEDYGMHLAHLLVQGVDLWMNLPRVPLEASGTSGMKAALNGVPQLSTIDGWWEEGYDGNERLGDRTGSR